MKKSTACSWCKDRVSVHYFASDVDRGDRGYIRSCLHGDYVPASELTVEGN